MKKINITLKIQLITCIVLFLGTCHRAESQGFLAGTLVKTPSGYTPIENLKTDDRVISFDGTGKCVEARVERVIQNTVDSVIGLWIYKTPTAHLEKEVVYATPDTKFYCANQQKWLSAENIFQTEEGHELERNIFVGNCQKPIYILDFAELPISGTIYDLIIPHYQNFCVSKYDIHVHNFAVELGVTLEYLIGEGLAGLSLVPSVNVAVGVIAIGASAIKYLWKRDSIIDDINPKFAFNTERLNEKFKSSNQPKPNSNPGFAAGDAGKTPDPNDPKPSNTGTGAAPTPDQQPEEEWDNDKLKEAAEKIADMFGGEVKSASTEKGWRVTIPNGKRDIVVRFMESGSGQRSSSYFRVGIEGKTALDISGQLSNDPASTHIDMTSSFENCIKNMINNYRKLP